MGAEIGGMDFEDGGEGHKSRTAVASPSQKWEGNGFSPQSLEKECPRNALGLKLSETQTLASRTIK